MWSVRSVLAVIVEIVADEIEAHEAIEVATEAHDEARSHLLTQSNLSDCCEYKETRTDN